MPTEFYILIIAAIISFTVSYLSGVLHNFRREFRKQISISTKYEHEMMSSQRDIHLLLKDMQNTLRIVESKVSDLNIRVNIAEVRMEERKAQQFFMPNLMQQMSAAPKRPGRKPKLLR